MHLILTGATGLVGSATLDAMLKMKDITKISVLSRRPVPMADDAKDPRVNVVIHKDFESYPPELLEQLKGASGAVWALGISQALVSSEYIYPSIDYVKITRDYTLAGAKAFANLVPPGGEPFRFIYVSGMGATQKPGRFSQIFARVKGETETALSELRGADPRLAAESVRPAGVDPSDHPAIKPYIPVPHLTQRILVATLLPPMRLGLRSYLTPTEPMGKLFAEMAMGKHDAALQAGGDGIQTLKGGLRLLDNSALRWMGNMK